MTPGRMRRTRNGAHQQLVWTVALVVAMLVQIGMGGEHDRNKIDEQQQLGQASTTSSSTTTAPAAAATTEDETGMLHQLVPFQAKRLRPPDGSTNNNKPTWQDDNPKKDTNRLKNGASLDKCEYWLDGLAGGNFSSFAYPQPYPNNLDCRYRIPRHSPDVCQLELRFHEFDLALSETESGEMEMVVAEDEEKAASEPLPAVIGGEHTNEFSPSTSATTANQRRRRRRQKNNNCLDSDYLEFANGPKRYCGPNWKGRRDLIELTHGDSQFLFRFKTKHQQASKGFLIEYRPIRNSCPSGKVVDLDKPPKEQPKSARPYAEEVLRSLPTSASGCEERHTEKEFSIKSRNYPANYSHNEDCVYYVLKAADEVCGLEVRFNRFHLEESEACAYDFVEVDGENFCGRLPNGSRNIFRFSGDVKTISFQTDGQMSAPGFDISVRQLTDCENTFMPAENRLISGNIRTNKCSIVRDDLAGQLTSMRYPEPYPKDSLCAYTIKRAPVAHGREYCSIELDFGKFDLQDTLECRADFLELENRRHCGRSLNGTRRLVSFNEDGFVKFLFKSDMIDSNNAGFVLNYTQVECVHRTIGNELDLKEGENVPQAYNVPHVPKDKVEQARPTRTTPAPRPVDERPASNNQSLFYPEPCYQLFTEKKFMLKSEVTNGSYRENSDCLYAVRKSSPNVCYIEMEFEKFDLEASAECQYDYVEIGNAVRLCGTLHRETSRIYVFDKEEFFIIFHTDASNERAGFVIKAEQLECKGDRIVRNDNFDVNMPPTDMDKEEETRRKRTGDEPKDNLQSLEQSKHESRQEQQQQQQQQQEEAEEQTEEKGGRHKPQQVLQQQESISTDYDLLQDRVSHLPPSSLACSSLHNEREFFIHSPSYPRGYQPDLDCLHLIRPHSASTCKLEINFDSFELQPYDYTKNCLKSDFLDVDGRETFCGKMHESQSKVYSFLNESFVIHFHSDAFKTSFDKGFRLFVRQIDCGSVSNFGAARKFKASSGDSGVSSFIPRIYSRCNKLYTTTTFEIKSPHYPTYYPSNTVCQYRVAKVRRPGPICFLEVAFVNFELQDSFNCSKDYVNFNGIKVCGTLVKDSIRVFPFYGDEFVIHFSADRLINGRFHLFARQAECSETVATGLGGGALQPPPSFGNDDDEPVRGGGGGGRKIFPPRLLPPYVEKNDVYSNVAIFQTNQRCQQLFNTMLFEIESPNYPHYYLPSLGCSYTVQRRHSRICRLELHMVDFDVEPSVRCLSDYVLIDGVKYCNTNRPDPIIVLPFHEAEKTISFQSVSLRRRKGFHIRARQVECDPWAVTARPSTAWPAASSSSRGTSFEAHDGKKVIILPSLPSICEICVTEVTGAIQSYDYPNYYPPNVNCTYKITPLPGNCMLQIRFDEFDFDVTPACDLDFLEINGVRYCGSQLRGVSMILLNKRKEDLSIRMITDSRGALLKPSFRGFRATYTQLPCLTPEGEETPAMRPTTSRPSPAYSKTTPEGSKTILSPTRQQIQQSLRPNTSFGVRKHHDEPAIFCDQTFDTKLFTIQSPGYPYRYYDGIDCQYRITKASPNICRLKLTFQAFNVNGEDGFCRGDYLEVFGARICGVLEKFTTKEVPFLPERMTLKFHTNEALTANGFHIVGEQVDCLSFGSSKGRDDHQPTKTTQHHQQQQQEVFRYDDDEAMVGEGDDRKSTTTTTGSSVTSTTMPSTTTTRMSTKSTMMATTTSQPRQVDVTPKVYYADMSTTTPSSMSPAPFGRKQSNENPKTSPAFPLRYYSHNITVVNRDKDQNKEDEQRFSQQQQQQMWDHRDEQHPQQETMSHSEPMHNMSSSNICDQGLVDKMYFELKGSQLRPAVDGKTVAGCQIRVKKAKPSICQLDIMFVRYDFDAATCGQQYLSVDGERICGHVPPSTIKKFWFIRSELLLFAKLARPEERIFEVKVRQVECAGNVEQKPIDSVARPMIEQKQDMYDQQQRTISSSFEYSSGQVEKQQKWDSSYYDRSMHQQQQQLADPVEEQRMEPPSKKERPSSMHDGGAKTKPNKMMINADGYQRHCDIIESEAQFRIVSPHDEAPHRCRYTVRKASEAVCAIDIRFDMFRLADDGKCAAEYLDIDSGKICGAFPVGHERRYYFLPNEYEKYIYFNSSLMSGGGDFRLQVKQVEDCQKPLASKKPSLHTPTVCEKNIRNVQGRIQSPNYPAPYDEFTRCTYRIQANEGQYCRVRLLVRDLDIEVGHQHQSTKECDRDVLEFGGHKLCGKVIDNEREFELPFEMIDGQKMVQLMFSSDATGSGRGFDIEYHQEMCPMPSPPQPHQPSSMGGSSSSFGKGWRGNTAIRLVSPTNGLKGLTNRFKAGQSMAAPTDNSLNPNPMRPNYPPNYVSKAHLTKTMDRKEFIKLFMMMDEKDHRKVSLNENDRMLTSSSTTTASSITTTTAKVLPTRTSTTHMDLSTSTTTPISTTTTTTANEPSTIVSMAEIPLMITTPIMNISSMIETTTSPVEMTTTSITN